MELSTGKKKWLVIAGSAIALIIIYKIFFGGNGDIEYNLAKAEIGNVKQIVSVTGTVEADPEIELKFQKNGIASKINVKVGDKVEENDLLAELQNTDEKIQVQQYGANLKLAKANLDLKNAGASNEDIAVTKASLDSAQTSLEAAKQTLENKIAQLAEDIRKNDIAVKDAEDLLEAKKQALERAQTSLENTSATYSQNNDNSLTDARITVGQSLVNIRSALTQADNILGVDNGDLNDSFEDLLGVLKRSTKVNAENSYETAIDEYNSFKTYYDALPPENNQETVLDLLNRVEALNLITKLCLNDTYTMLEYTLTSSDFSPTTLDAKKTLIDNAKTSLNTVSTNTESDKQSVVDAELSLNTQLNTSNSSLETAISNVETAENNLSTAKNNLSQAKLKQKSDEDLARNDVNLKEAEYNKALASYNFKIAKAREVDVAGLKAQVEKANADLQLANATLAKTLLKAPAPGVIARINGEKGENILTADTFIKMISSRQKILANISEVDITKVHLDDPVEITLDALPPDMIFKARIADIDPAETLVQGVVYYQIHVYFDKDPEEVKPGMTVNLEILASEKKDVLVIPTRAVKYGDEGKYVEMIDKNGKLSQIPIKTGIEGDFNTEIISGVKDVFLQIMSCFRIG